MVPVAGQDEQSFRAYDDVAGKLIERGSECGTKLQLMISARSCRLYHAG
jgi:hypothetical protein